MIGFHSETGCGGWATSAPRCTFFHLVVAKVAQEVAQGFRNGHPKISTPTTTSVAMMERWIKSARSKMRAWTQSPAGTGSASELGTAVLIFCASQV